MSLFFQSNVRRSAATRCVCILAVFALSGCDLSFLTEVESSKGDTSSSDQMASTLQAPAIRFPKNASTTTDYTPMLTWFILPGASKYQVTYSLSLNAVKSGKSISVTNLYHEISPPLKPGNTVYWRVRGIDTNANPGKWSTIYSFTIEEPSVVNLRPSGGEIVTTTSPTLSWSETPNSSGYELQYAPKGEDLESSEIFQTEKNLYTVPLVQQNTLYYWRVRALDDQGDPLSWSTAESFFVSSDGSGRPSLVSPANGQTVVTAKPTFSWQSFQNASTYRIEINSVEGSTKTTSITQDVTQNSYALGSKLYNMTTYRWRVRATLEGGKYSAWSDYNSFFVQDSAINNDIVILSPLSKWPIADKEIVLSCLAIDDVVSYEFAVARQWQQLDSAKVHSSSSPEYFFIADQYGAYYWRVRTLDVDGITSEWSEIHSFKTSLPIPKLTSPARYAKVDLKYPEKLRWEAVSLAKSYEVQIVSSLTKGGIENEPVHSVKGTSVDISQISSGNGFGYHYTWRVRAVYTNNARSEWSPNEIFFADSERVVDLRWDGRVGSWSTVGTTLNAWKADDHDTKSITVRRTFRYTTPTGKVRTVTVDLGDTEETSITDHEMPFFESRLEALPKSVRSKEDGWAYTDYVKLPTPQTSVSGHKSMVSVLKTGQTGKFKRGDATNTSPASDDRPVRTVTLTHPYSIDRYETSASAFLEVMKAAGVLHRPSVTFSGSNSIILPGSYHGLIIGKGLTHDFYILRYDDPRSPYDKRESIELHEKHNFIFRYLTSEKTVPIHDGDKHVAMGITWLGAAFYVFFLNELLDLPQTFDPYTLTFYYKKGGYSLPTAAEWEYAARDAGKQTGGWVGSGNDIERRMYMRYGKDEDDFPVVKARHLRSYMGLLLNDMTGNVREWTADRYADDYYDKTGYKYTTNPRGATNTSSFNREIRGGAYFGELHEVMVSSRDYFPIDDGHRGNGFRVIRY